MTRTGSHWRDMLPGDLAPGENTVSVRMDTETDNAALAELLTRLPALIEALRPPTSEQGDPLDAEASEDLLALLAHLHRVRAVLEGQEERVLTACHRRGVSLRALAATLELNSPESVRKRLTRVLRGGGRLAGAGDD